MSNVLSDMRVLDERLRHMQYIEANLKTNPDTTLGAMQSVSKECEALEQRLLRITITKFKEFVKFVYVNQSLYGDWMPMPQDNIAYIRELVFRDDKDAVLLGYTLDSLSGDTGTQYRRILLPYQFLHDPAQFRRMRQLQMAQREAAELTNEVLTLRAKLNAAHAALGVKTEQVQLLVRNASKH